MSDKLYNSYILKEEISKAKSVLYDYLKTYKIAPNSIFLIGSTAMGIQLSTSDIDFAVGVSQEIKDKIKSNLPSLMEFRGERPARKTTTRLLFCTKLEDRHIDLNIMDLNDSILFKNNLAKAVHSLSDKDKQDIVDKKMYLKERGHKEDYERFKIELYKRFFLDFLWLTDHEIAKAMIDKFVQKNEPIPFWLAQKLLS
jgi:predicted nucleotidyltransferase